MLIYENQQYGNPAVCDKEPVITSYKEPGYSCPVSGSKLFSPIFFQGKKAELKSYIIELSKEFSILSQFTSFVAIEERVRLQLPDRCLFSTH